MHLLYNDIHECRALVVEGNPTTRSILVAQLRDFGVGHVQQVSRAVDARRALEFKEFDIVLCEQQFHGSNYSGQALLDDLRRANLLPFSTVFVMITSEASYDKVAEAAESALDSYLLKPHTATILGDRLIKARHRKKTLKPIFDALAADEFEQAAKLCLQRFSQREPYWLYAARIGAEVLLRLGRHADAQKLFEAVIAAQALPWAKLGVARAQAESGQTAAAIQTLAALTSENPGYTDGYDVLGRIHLEQGDLEQALAVYRLASESTPGSIVRLQKNGMLAFYLGHVDEAADKLDRAAFVGVGSKMFDAQSLVLLAFVRFRKGDSKGLYRCVDHMAQALEVDPDSVRLRRFAQVLRVLSLMRAKQLAEVVNEVRLLMGQVHDVDFDVEAGCNALALLAELTVAELTLEGAQTWVDKIALRFCTSRATTELLARAAGLYPAYAEQILQAHRRVNAMAQQAVKHTLERNPLAAVESLVADAGLTLNARLMDTARLTLLRYKADIANANERLAPIETWLSRYQLAAKVPVLGQPLGRSEGGVALRAGSAASSAKSQTPAPA